jgi:hypothetical protein
MRETLKVILKNPNNFQIWLKNPWGYITFCCLLARHTKGKKPLVDYSQSHVMTTSKYLDILRRKIMEKVVVEEIREGNWKEKEENRTKRTTKLGFAIDRTTQKCVEKRAKA